MATQNEGIPADWHELTVEVPVPTLDQAETILQTIAPDKPVKSPELVRRTLHVRALPTPHILIAIAAATLRQARVSVDHLLSDLELVVETMAAFSPAPPP
ncbi:hypothetical protein PCANC_05654 [Puccinia coronata f. sp. avenae]|uniref:Transcription factor Pcc1 n=1 Tax=Puccinia coronata f. sp. avenae TaxID=200324 RepID=A0A2N5UM98_9BASI|nr:hypothetical protein PCASD_15160 [Puccinia coronata f. sp. avenae]PLW34854.1 hypothetical protein PCASD_15076 [Puccinia coronata f. sp. avenae]PLW38885.1 hypothetical protein PCANC_15913 [Puccinia coronata f. sp. avenae]PLW54845.1 hypothetical protein PCANC_05654 [Puccinia coronata f. sp. avenae]